MQVESVLVVFGVYGALALFYPGMSLPVSIIMEN